MRIQRNMPFAAIASILFAVVAVVSTTGAGEPDASRCSMWIDDCRGEPVRYETVLEDLATADVIYLGERHTVERHHDLQAKIVRDLAGKGIPLVLGIEMMEKPNQPALDRYSAGEIDFDTLAKETHWDKRWSNYEQYKGVLEAAKAAGAPVVALNAKAETIRAVARSGGVKGLDEKLRAELPKDIQLDDPVYRKTLEAPMKSHMAASPERLRPMIEAQIARDETMADTLCQFLQSDRGKGRAAIVLCGAGHVSQGLGTPARVRRRLPDSTERIVIFSASGDVKLTKKQLAMTRHVHVPREETRSVNVRVADYLHVTSPREEERGTGERMKDEE